MEAETLERKLDCSSLRNNSMEEKYRLILSSFQGVRDLAHTAVDAMNTVAKDIFEYSLFNQDKYECKVERSSFQK